MNARANDDDIKHARSRLEGSRGELQELFEPTPPNQFPRSKTMRLLTSNKGATAALALVGGVLLWRTGLGKRAFAMIPMGALAKSLAIRLLRN